MQVRVLNFKVNYIIVVYKNKIVVFNKDMFIFVNYIYNVNLKFL